MNLETLLKAIVGWVGLLYFFKTEHENWGEAVGLTLFYASGQLRSTVRPPFLEDEISSSHNWDRLQEIWRITLGMASCLYYFYFELYLNTGLNIYVSTVCLSLFWESQIADEVIDTASHCVSKGLPSAYAFSVILLRKTKDVSCSTQVLIRNRVQEFLCLLCKLYKHFRTSLPSLIALIGMSLTNFSTFTYAIASTFLTEPKSIDRTKLLASLHVKTGNNQINGVPQKDDIDDVLAANQHCTMFKPSAVRQRIGYFPCIF